MASAQHKPHTTEGTCNEDICSHFIGNYKRSNFYEQTITRRSRTRSVVEPDVPEVRQGASGASKSNMQSA